MKNLLFVLALLLCVDCSADPKTLIVILGETRAHELTYENIERNLIQPLVADLAICIGVRDDYDYDNPFYQRAIYRFTYPEPADYGTAFDYAYDTITNEAPVSQEMSLPWREFLKIKDQFLGGIHDASHQHPGSAGILIFYRWFLLKNLLEHGLLDTYDFFIITRSDYIYQLPHPSMELFSNDSIYIPDGEQYGGVTDRHVILPKKFVVSYLNILNMMVVRGREYFEKMSGHSCWNLEQLIQFHLTQQNVFDSVKFFPYVMYSVRPINGTSRWSMGNFSEKLGYFIKYHSEYERSSMHKSDFAASGGTLTDFYQARIKDAPQAIDR